MTNLINRTLVAEKKLLHILFIVTLAVAAITMQSCKQNDDKYTVWTDTTTYSDFQSSFQTTLGDGNYIKVEIGPTTWENMAKSLTSEGRHRWDEATIKKWFISYGFGEIEATRESSWLTIVDHGLVVVRNGNIVNLILK